MIRNLASALRRFRRGEQGEATIEFALTFPAMLFLLLSGVGMGMVTLQHSMLERAMDITVRDIRLGTGTAPQHDEIKDLLCERSGFVSNCKDNMRLEMVEVNPRNWSGGLSDDVDCTDKSEDVEPLLAPDFKTDAQENALMILRACAKIDPVFPTAGLGKNVQKDGAGQFSLVAISVFVQEPR